MTNANMARKKFKDTAVGRILIGAAGVISPPLGKLLAGTGTAGEALQYIRTSDIPQEEKAKLEALYVEQQIVEDQEITKRWQSDNDAGKVTRYIRPVSLIVVTSLMLFFTYLDSADMIAFHVEEKWVTFWQGLAMIMYGAYFGGKSMEKTFRK